ncbi:MAG: response regulator [Planctomycetia bacterium]|nr:response regulator [Planctomycetia bacterium]
MSKKILLVDGNAAFRTAMVPELAEAGYEVTEVETAEAARQALSQSAFDLAISNTALEHVDSGFGLAFHMKQDYPAMPVILVTKVNQQEGLHFTLNSAAERAWIKADVLLDLPIRGEQLLSEIKRLTA